MDNGYKRMLVAGITYNKVERGVYALILQELGGTRRLPIVIGIAEAQSIECKLQEIITPRPLTHDLMVNVMRAFGLALEHVEVKQLDGGIFAADLHLTDGDRKVVIDARSSDGISIALRMGVPVYIKEDLLDKVGVSPKSHSADDSDGGQETSRSSTVDDNPELWRRIDRMTDEELQEQMRVFVDSEEYENAARVKEIIDRRSRTNTDV